MDRKICRQNRTYFFKNAKIRLKYTGYISDLHFRHIITRYLLSSIYSVADVVICGILIISYHFISLLEVVKSFNFYSIAITCQRNNQFDYQVNGYWFWFTSLNKWVMLTATTQTTRIIRKRTPLMCTILSNQNSCSIIGHILLAGQPLVHI